MYKSYNIYIYMYHAQVIYYNIIIHNNIYNHIWNQTHNNVYIYIYICLTSMEFTHPFSPQPNHGNMHAKPPNSRAWRPTHRYRRNPERPTFEEEGWMEKISSKTPKSSILVGFSIINHPFWGTPVFGNTRIYIYICNYSCIIYIYIPHLYH